MKNGAQLIAEERGRQMTPKSSGGEGWTQEHDDTHINDELLRAGICYAMLEVNDVGYANASFDEWPWEQNWCKPGKDENGIQNLVKAGALIAAEIDRRKRVNK